jgi:predicted transcriptional regulator
MREVLQTVMGQGAGISKIMFYAYLTHSQATAWLSRMVEDGLVVNDVKRGKRFYRTTPKGVEYLKVLKNACEPSHMEIRTPRA